MEYILIIIIQSFNLGGGAAMQEFSSLEACTNAREAVEKTEAMNFNNTKYSVICVPKGVIK